MQLSLTGHSTLQILKWLSCHWNSLRPASLRLANSIIKLDTQREKDVSAWWLNSWDAKDVRRATRVSVWCLLPLRMSFASEGTLSWLSLPMSCLFMLPRLCSFIYVHVLNAYASRIWCFTILTLFFWEDWMFYVANALGRSYPYRAKSCASPYRTTDSTTINYHHGLPLLN